MAAATEAARLTCVCGKSRARVIDTDSERGREYGFPQRRLAVVGHSSGLSACSATHTRPRKRSRQPPPTRLNALACRSLSRFAVNFAQSLRGAGIHARRSNLVTSAVVGLAPRKVASLRSVARTNPDADLLSMFAGARGKPCHGSHHPVRGFVRRHARGRGADLGPSYRHTDLSPIESVWALLNKRVAKSWLRAA